MGHPQWHQACRDESGILAKGLRRARVLFLSYPLGPPFMEVATGSLVLGLEAQDPPEISQPGEEDAASAGKAQRNQENLRSHKPRSMEKSPT